MSIQNSKTGEVLRKFSIEGLKEQANLMRGYTSFRSMQLVPDMLAERFLSWISPQHFIFAWRTTIRNIRTGQIATTWPR